MGSGSISTGDLMAFLSATQMLQKSKFEILENKLKIIRNILEKFLENFAKSL